MPGLHASRFKYHLAAALTSAVCDESQMMDEGELSASRTELDSHANMAVVGRNATVISKTGNKVDVSAFTPDYKPLTVEVVDAAVRYECPYSNTVAMLVIRNALHVPAMQHNLLPPFMMREAGIHVKDTPKIQIDDPSIEDHSIYFKETGLRIPLSLDGVFSYFPTNKPSEEKLMESEDIYLLTPEHWNPNSMAYAKNEESMLDWEGNLVEPRFRKTEIPLMDIPDGTQLSSVKISAAESSMVDNNMAYEEMDFLQEPTTLPYDQPPGALNQVSSVLRNVSGTLDDLNLCALLEQQARIGQYKMSIGATTVTGLDLDDDLSASSSSECSCDDDECSCDMSPPLSDLEFIQDLAQDDLTIDDFMASAASAGERRGVKPDHLSKIWRISHEEAKATLEATSQKSIRTDNPKLSRNYGTNDRMLRYRRIRDYFFMDTFFATKRRKNKKYGTSTRGNTCCQVFVTDKNFVYVVPMKSKQNIPQALKQFAKAVGAPEAIICDFSGEQNSEEVRKFLSDIGTTLRALEEGTPWSNKAELYIGLLKEGVRKDMREANCPLVFWDYCIERRARINNLTVKDSFKLQAQNPQAAVLGDDGDISSLCQHGFYDWVYYRDQTATFPFNKEVLGRVLGPSEHGNQMCQMVLKANGRVVPKRSIRPLTVAEQHSETEKQKQDVFDRLIEARHGTSINPPTLTENENDEQWDPYADEEEDAMEMPEFEDAVDANGMMINQLPAYDKLIHAEVQMHLDEQLCTGKVTRRAIGPNGRTSGTYDENPYLNTMIYEVEFMDGQVREYGANLIAENMLTHVDSDGFSTTMMEGIIDHRKDEGKAIPVSDGYIVSRSGQKRRRQTTKGWELLVRWKDQTESWIHLKDLKEAHPVEVSEYARARNIDHEPAFAWWVPYTLRKRDVILSAVRKRIRKTTRKYGIEIPTSVEHAYELDRADGTSPGLWRKALELEMYNVGVAFEILPDGQPAPKGWHKVTGHIIWDLKMDFTRKARWVLDGHKTADPVGSTYAGVVSRESVRIALTYAALNELDVCAADIRNAYLQAPSSQKDYIVCGAEFGLENVGRVALIHRALYGGKAAGRDFRNHLRSCMSHLGFESCPADPDVWLRPSIKADGSTYYTYILLYTDDALVIGEHAEKVLRQELGKYFRLKEKSIGPPDIYLGGKMREVVLDNGVKAWAFGSSQYVHAAVKNVEDYLAKQPKPQRYTMPSKAETPLRTTYRAELDVTPELKPLEGAYYQSLIGVLRWIVELGRVDICLETSIMSSHLALPREGHLEQLFHMFAYLKKYHNAELVYDPTVPEFDMDLFKEMDWASSEFGHIQGKEALPSNIREPRGCGFTISAKVDADHASDTITRRSRTGFIVYLNSAPCYWFSKKQNSIESSSFGSEFCAMKLCCEYIRGLRYKLRMMGIPVHGPALIHGDNQSVLANTTIPDSTLKKKSQSIAYHFVREGVARSEWRTAYVNTHDNEADLLTKQLPNGEKRRGFVRRVLHHIFATYLKRR